MASKLINDIDAFLAETGMGSHRFGFLAAKNGRLVERLRAGETKGGKTVLVRPETEAQIRAFMITHRRRPSKVQAAE